MKKTSYYASIAAIFLIVLLPLIVSNSLFFPFISGKAIFFRVFAEIAFFAWVIAAFLEPKFRPRATGLNLAVTAFAVIVLVADLLGVNPLRSIWSNFERMEGWMMILHLWGLYIAATSIFGVGEAGRKMWHRWLGSSLAVSGVIALYGVGQYIGLFAIHQSADRLDATLGNSAYMAVYMLVHIGIALFLYFSSSSRKAAPSAFAQLLVGTATVGLAILLVATHSILAALITNIVLLVVMAALMFLKPVLRPSGMAWLYSVILALFSAVVVQTQTRGTVFGLVAMAVIFLLCYGIFGKSQSKSSRYVSVGIVAAMLVLGVAFYLNKEAKWIQSSPLLSRFANISWSVSSGQARQWVWPMAIQGASERPILGWGQENFNYIFNAHYNPAMYGQEQWFDRAHSVYLDWLVAGGVIGLLSYLSLYVLFLVYVWRSNLGLMEKSALTALLGGYFVHNLFVFDNLSSYMLFFSLLAFVASLRAEGAKVIGGNKPMHLDAVEYIVAPIVILALAAGLYFVDVKSYSAGRSLIKALNSCNANTLDSSLFTKAMNSGIYTGKQEAREQALTCASNVISSQGINGAVKEQFYQLALGSIQDQIASAPKDARIYVLAGNFFNAIGDFEKAKYSLGKAIELTPTKQSVMFELINSEINTGKYAEAVVLAKKAYDEAPEFSQASLAYAVTLALADREAEARKIFNNDPAIFNTMQMARVYINQKKYSKAVAIISDLSKASPDDVNLKASLADTLNKAGRTYEAIDIFKEIEKSRPDLKEQVEAAIKQLQSR